MEFGYKEQSYPQMIISSDDHSIAQKMSQQEVIKGDYDGQDF